MDAWERHVRQVLGGGGQEEKRSEKERVMEWDEEKWGLVLDEDNYLYNNFVGKLYVTDNGIRSLVRAAR